jgi:hypothetical protein
MSKKLNVEAIKNELHGASLFFQPTSRPKEASQPVVPLLPIPDQNDSHRIVRAQQESETRTPEYPNARTGERANSSTPEHVNTRTDERMNARTPEQVNTRPPKRVITRESYNVYKDQHQALKRLEAMSALDGKSKPLSEMVREALDTYLQKNLNKEK